MNRALGLAAIFAIAVLAGCSSQSRHSSPTTGTLSPTTNPQKLTGAMDDWIRAVCVMVADGGTAGFMPEAENGKNCASTYALGNGKHYPIFIGTYKSTSALAHDLTNPMWGPHPPYLGPYAEGVDPASNEVVVFALRDDDTPVSDDPQRPLKPLVAFGFTVQEAVHPTVMPPPPQPPPGNSNAMPPPTVMPPTPGNATSQYVRTESGRMRCVVQPDQVACEASVPGSTGFLQAPITMPESQCKYSPCPGGMHSDLAEVTALGAFHWNDGNIGGVGSDWEQTDTTLGYGQTYHISGWTVLPSSDGTRFTNAGTGHGMLVSVENVSSF
jgi:hypothetical protein